MSAPGRAPFWDGPRDLAAPGEAPAQRQSPAPPAPWEATLPADPLPGTFLAQANPAPGVPPPGTDTRPGALTAQATPAPRGMVAAPAARPGDYFILLNHFEQWSDSCLPLPGTMLLYYKLLAICNRLRWPEWFRADNARLMAVLRTQDNKKLSRSRRELEKGGWIEYRPGGKGCPGRYRITPVGHGGAVPYQTTANTHTQTPTITPANMPDQIPTNMPTNTPDQMPTNTTTNTPPQTPDIRKNIKQDKKKDGETRRTPDGFESFWAAYPKKTGKGAAQRVWQGIGPDEGLVGEILRAVEAQRGWSGWAEEGGRYIPNPANWLDQRRWEDEPFEGQPVSRWELLE